MTSAPTPSGFGSWNPGAPTGTEEAAPPATPSPVSERFADVVKGPISRRGGDYATTRTMIGMEARSAAFWLAVTILAFPLLALYSFPQWSNIVTAENIRDAEHAGNNVKAVGIVSLVLLLIAIFLILLF